MAKRSPLTFNTTTISSLREEETNMLANTQTPMRANKKSREGRRFIAAHVSIETIKQMGLLSIQQGRTKQNILIEAIDDLFAKYGLSRIADE